MPTTFDTIDYLQKGNEKQQRAYTALTSHQILSKLKSFDPILVGTIPIRIDIETSDLDIICHFTEKKNFIEHVTNLFKGERGFILREQLELNAPAVIVNFFIADFEIEIFGQNIPTKQQYAYRHMLIEHALLLKYGEIFRQQIIALKQQGYKTEPAFAIALGLKGDPYQALLDFE